MAFDAGAIKGRLQLDDAPWRQAINRAKADANSLGGAILRNAGDIRKFGLALTAVGTGVTVMTTKLTNMAAEVEESENLFRESMGGMAKAAYDWSQEVSKALGVNQFEIRKMVGTYNVMLNSMGLAENQAYDMSTALTKLAYDMASFYNLEPEEAFMKLQSGISGEVEPLKRLGILVNENIIKQWAYNNSLVAAGEQLTEQQKVYARYMVIMEQTKKAQGDLLRTADSYTNISKRLTSQLEELGATLGESTKESMVAIKKVLLDIVGAVKEWVDANPKLAGTIMLSIDIFGKLLLVLGAIAFALPSIVAGFVTMGPFILPVLGAVAAAAIAVWAAFKYWDEIRLFLWSFVEGVNYAISEALTGIADFIEGVENVGGLSGVWWRFAANATQALATVLEKLAEYTRIASQVPGMGALGWGGALENVLRAGSSNLSNASARFSQRAAEIAEGASHEVSDSVRKMSDAVQENADFAREKADEVMNDIMSKNSETTDAIKTKSDELTNHLSNNLDKTDAETTKVLDKWKEEWKDVYKGLPKYQKEALDQMATQFQTYVDQGLISQQQFSEWYKFRMDKIGGDTKNEFNLMEELSTQAARNMQNAFSDLFFDMFTGKLKSAEDAFRQFGEAMLRTVSNLLAQQAVQWLFGGGIGGGGLFGGGGWGGGLLGGSSGGGLFGMLGGLFGFAEGADEVPYTGLFKVHKGEEITPRWGSASEGKGEELVIYNIITPEAIAAAMRTKEGENTIVNIINENSLRNGVIRREVVRR